MWQVYLKEIRELIRDRKTLIFMIIMPALMLPLITGGMSWVTGQMAQKANNKVLKYAVLGADHDSEFVRQLATLPKLEKVAGLNEDQLTAAIHEEKIHFALVLPKGFEQALERGQAMPLNLHYNDAVSFDTVKKRVNKQVEAYAQQVRSRYLATQGMNEGVRKFVAEPILLKVQSTAQERERIGELVGAFLPYLLLMMGLAAAMPTAMDIGAGEKERGTLESLLLLPLPRHKLVLAKFAVVATAGMLAGSIAVLSLGLFGGLAMQVGGSMEGALAAIISGIGLREVSLIALLMLPANAIVAALLLTMSLYARSHKEASAYGSQLMFLMIIPILLALLPGIKLDSGWAFVPITNIALSVKEIVKGTLNLSHLIITLGSTSLLAALFLRICTQWCQREAVLFRN